MPYEREIYEASQAYGVPSSVIEAVIDIESTWNPRAYRFEPDIPHLRNNPEFKGQDASYGLMQILYSTAKDLGYTGSPEGLYDPSTNINIGTKYLARLYGRYGNWLDTIAAYNGGHWAIQNKSGNTYPNQHHVNKFVAAWDKYKKKSTQTTVAKSTQDPRIPTVDISLVRTLDPITMADPMVTADPVWWNPESVMVNQGHSNVLSHQEKGLGSLILAALIFLGTWIITR